MLIFLMERKLWLRRDGWFLRGGLIKVVGTMEMGIGKGKLSVAEIVIDGEVCTYYVPYSSLLLLNLASFL
jgi:hypothetical protein